ncbi:hypothetical protein EWM64_g4367 [Hericium alpestre]|uniref:Uncharacterized protein n=1 Tax=Hericium alpestre TaxID=135208 RepID=A0A4Y9ZYQ0_9AGAM|nr:hypothetical protein EWM64_g4367 [Hericium alpestre]
MLRSALSLSRFWPRTLNVDVGTPSTHRATLIAKPCPRGRFCQSPAARAVVPAPIGASLAASGEQIADIAWAQAWTGRDGDKERSRAL